MELLFGKQFCFQTLRVSVDDYNLERKIKSYKSFQTLRVSVDVDIKTRIAGIVKFPDTTCIG